MDFKTAKEAFLPILNQEMSLNQGMEISVTTDALKVWEVWNTDDAWDPEDGQDLWSWSSNLDECLYFYGKQKIDEVDMQKCNVVSLSVSHDDACTTVWCLVSGADKGGDCSDETVGDVLCIGCTSD